MGVRKKKILIIAGGIAALLAIAAIIAVASIDINSYKPKIEAAASEATGMEVVIKGRIGFSFFPFGASAKDIHVSSKAGEIVSVKKLLIGAELIPLLKGQIKVTECELVRPAVTIIKDAAGNYNFGVEKKAAAGGAGAAFGMNRLKLSSGALLYLDKKTGEKTELKDLNVTISGLSINDTGSDILKNISFAGNADCKTVRHKNLVIENLKADVKAGKGIFSIKPLTMDIIGGKGEGEITADLSGAVESYKMNFKLPKFNFEKLTEAFEKKKSIRGEGVMTASLAARGKGSRQILRSLNGHLSIRGDDLTIYMMDLDKVLSKFEETQKFNLVDLGAFFIAGPLGTAVTKGYSYGDVYTQSRGGQGVIKKLVSDWKIVNGMADAEDCAFATQRNRVALKGKLDLVGARYDNVIVAILDDKGCAKFKQKINGPFDSPQIGTVSTLQSAAGPILNLFSKAKSLIEGGRCEVFYNGSVPHPK